MQGDNKERNLIRKEWEINNKDKIALAGRRYYEKMKSDPEFMKKKREQAKKQREKQKHIQKEKHAQLQIFAMIEEEKNKSETNTDTNSELCSSKIPIKIKKPMGRPRKY